MLQSVNNYCERLDTSFWSEPINAASNASFILAALIVYFTLKKHHDRASALLIAILAAIGVGSFLFHTFAQQWAALADSLPILLFILVYIYFATRRFLNRTPLVSAISVLAFFPFAAATSWLVVQTLGPLNGSAGYVSVAILIGIYALAMLQKSPKTATGLALGAAILAASITFRSVDQALCDSISVGTHFIWHILNGIMLGWMIIVLSRHQKNRPPKD